MPPLKYLSVEKLQDCLNLVKEGGYMAMHIMTEDQTVLELACSNAKKLQGVKVFKSGPMATDEDSIVLIFAKNTSQETLNV